MTPVRLAIVASVVATFTLLGVPAATAQQPGTTPQQPPAPGAPATPATPLTPGAPATPETPVEGQQPPAPEEEPAPPPTVEVPGAERPPTVPEQLVPSEGFTFRVPTLTIGDSNLFLPPLPRGRLQLTPSLTFGVEWDDNVRRSRDDERSDFILQITPGITLRAVQPRYRVLAGYNTSAELFLQGNDDDEVARRHRLFVDAFYQHDPRLSFRLTERFVFDRNTDVVTVSGISTGARHAYRNTITPVARWQATPLTALEASVSYSLVRFDEDDDVPDGRDTDTYRVTVSGDHRFTQRLTGLADFGFAYFDIDDEPEAYTYTPRVGLSYDFTPRLRGYVSGGVTVLQRSDDLSTSPAFNAGLRHLYRWGTVELAYDRAIAADGLGVNDRQTVLAAVRVLTLMRGLTLELLTRYTMADIERGSRDEDREALSVNARLVYRITATVSAIGSYTYYMQTSDRRASEYDQNRIFLGLQYAYPINLD